MGLGITFDLERSNRIFKENLKSLLVISKDNLVLIAAQNLENIIENVSTKKETEWFDKNSHLANIEWILLNSIYTSVYSFFEYHLYALVKVVEERSKSKIKLKDISGKGIVQSINYLHLVGDLASANNTSSEWQAIKNFQKVRHILVHNDGIMVTDRTIPLSKHELYGFLKKNNVVMAGTLGHIRIREVQIIESFLNTAFSLSDNLVAEINTKYPV